MSLVSHPPAEDLIATSTREATMALLGDTFAIHEVGERIAYTEVLPHLVRLGVYKPRKRLTLMVSAREFTERFNLFERHESDASIVALAPMVESAVETLRGILSEDDFEWKQCDFTAGVLERDGASPVGEGELRLLISPAGGAYTISGAGPSLPSGTHHAVSRAVAPGGCPLPDDEVVSTLVERSRSGDLLATCGLVSYLRRNEGIGSALSEDTLRQVAFEFPPVMDDGSVS